MYGVKKFLFVVSLAGNVRPLIGGLNGQLANRGAGPVRKEEWPEIDRMLHEDLRAPASESKCCHQCGGYVSTDIDGDMVCLTCGRRTSSRRQLSDVIQMMAQKLIERRAKQPREASERTR